MAKVKIDFSKAEEKLAGLGSERGRFAMLNQMHMDMEEFVPMKDGDLRNLSSVHDKSIVYSREYAAPMFYKQFRNYTTPGTGPRWDEVATSQYLDDWIDAYLRGAGIDN